MDNARRANNAPKAVVRLLLLGLVMFGVLAMHQLPVMHQQQVMHEQVHPAAASAADHHRAGPGDNSLLTTPGGHDHGAMLHLCMAVIVTGFAALALWWLGTRRPRARAWFSQVIVVHIDLRPPLWLRPSLHSLQVLRL